jgi:uncharacterized protein YgiB involved in biofilm formation
MKLSNSKRSQKAALIFMLPAAGLVLGGCTEKQVQAAFAEAEQLHPQVAPRYANKQECEVDFGSGQCETAPQSNQQGSFFMPMMMGFMAGQMLNRGGLAAGGGQQASQQAAAGGRNSVPTQPLYKSRDDRNTFRTASNTAVASQPGTTNVRPSAVQPKAASLARRGGFGAQATQRSATRSYGG